jgi:hypothetical protein
MPTVTETDATTAVIEGAVGQWASAMPARFQESAVPFFDDLAAALVAAS